MSRKKLLITGFDPFGGETVNTSWESVRRLPDQIGDYDLYKLQIPTVFGLGASRVLEEAAKIRPDAILSVGQAGKRAVITPELVAVNLREARIPDNHGAQPVNTPVVPDGPAAYFATTPVREMVTAIREAGIQAELSLGAGAFVCNDVFYSLSHHFRSSNTLVGFIHVPVLPVQTDNSRPGMELEQILAGLTAAIHALP